MANPNLPKFKPGNKHAANAGNGNVKVRIVKSPLRKTSESLRQIEAECLELIKSAVRSGKVDKLALDTARWTISMIQTLDKAASAEEIASAKIRLDAKLAAEKGAGVDDIEKPEVKDHPTKNRLSLVFQPDEDDED